MDGRAQRAPVHGVAQESDMTEQLTHTFVHEDPMKQKVVM